MIRVFIIAASPLSRAGLENLLASRGVEIAGAAATVGDLTDQRGGSAADSLADAAADVVVLDTVGENLESSHASLLASGLPSETNVVLLADGISAEFLARALRGGIRAVLPREVSPDQLAAAVRAAAGGLIVLHPDASGALPVSAASTRTLEELVEPLTPREREVLQMLAGGYGNKQIAGKLGISEHTVKFHVTAILGKLGVAGRTEAVAVGIRRGLVLL